MLTNSFLFLLLFIQRGRPRVVLRDPPHIDLLELDDNLVMDHVPGKKRQYYSSSGNSSGGSKIVKSKRLSQLAEIQGPAAIMAVADGPNSSWSMINGISLKKETKVLPHDAEEDEEVDSNRSRGDELDNEEYYSLFVPATKDMTTQTSNPDEEVEFTNCKQEDDGIDNGIIGCAANGKESEERLVLDLMKRLEKLEEMDAERIEMEMEKNKRIDSLERNVEVLRSQLELERKNNEKLIEELGNHMRKKSRLDEEFIAAAAALPYNTSKSS
jgi:hypothetical protein